MVVGDLGEGWDFTALNRAFGLLMAAENTVFIALGLVGCGPGGALMVGDDIRGDIGGARDSGIDGVLVRTGKFQAGDLDVGVQPSAVLDSVAELPAWLDRRARGA